jgi:hypothetical protein
MKRANTFTRRDDSPRSRPARWMANRVRCDAEVETHSSLLPGSSKRWGGVMEACQRTSQPFLTTLLRRSCWLLVFALVTVVWSASASSADPNPNFGSKAGASFLI